MRKVFHITVFIVISLVFSSSIIYFFNKLTLSTFKEYNKAILYQDIVTVQNAFSRRIETIRQLNRDWAQWDDSYQFVQDQNPEFIEVNLVDETLESTNLNIILYFDREGYVIYKKAGTLGGVGDTYIPAEVLNYTTTNNKINIKKIIETGDQLSGFLSTTTGTFVFSVCPVTTSEGSGPAMGALMMGRYINDVDLQELENSTGRELYFIDHTALGSALHPDISLSDLQKAPIIVDKGDYFSAYVLTTDSWGNPAKVINIHHELSGMAYAKQLSLVLSVITITSALSFTLIMAYFLRNEKLCILDTPDENV